MAERNEISGLLAFIGREGDWRERLQEVVAEHLMPSLEEFELDQEGLADLLGEQWLGVLLGCGFEDLLGRRYEGGNIVDFYLKRRGWKETALNQAYFAALRDAPVRLIHAGREQFGILVELIIGAITRALGDGKAAVGLKDFARFYAERSGDVSARNPFLVPDFRSIPTGRAPLDPAPPTPPKGGRRKPRGKR